MEVVLSFIPETSEIMDIVEEFVSRQNALKAIALKRKHKDGYEEEVAMEEQPLSPAARLFHQPHFNCYIISIMGSKTKIDIELVKAGLQKTLLKHPRFSSIQVMDKSKNIDKMRWVPTIVKLDDHISIPDLDQNMEFPDKFVEDYIHNLTATTLEMSRPLWDLHLLNIKISDAEAVGIFRIHHSLGDGLSLMSLLLACTRKTSDPKELPTVPVKKVENSEKPYRPWMIFFGLWAVYRLLVAIWHTFRLAKNTFLDILAAIWTCKCLRDTDTHFKSAPGEECTPRRIVYRNVSLDDIKLVKNAMGMTINDVVLGVTAAGLSRYLNRRYGEGKKDDGFRKMRNYLPENIRLRATLLVNVRPSLGIQALADTMKKDKNDTEWGNWVGIVLLPFKIGLRDDPLDYIREAKMIIDRKKCSLESIYTFACAAFVVKSFGIKAASIIAKKILSQTTMTFSNVVGPLEEISFYGHPMAYLASSVYGHPQGLTIHYQSYIDKMIIVLGVDDKRVPDPHQLIDDLQESLNLIKKAIIAKRS